MTLRCLRDRNPRLSFNEGITRILRRLHYPPHALEVFRDIFIACDAFGVDRIRDSDRLSTSYYVTLYRLLKRYGEYGKLTFDAAAACVHLTFVVQDESRNEPEFLGQQCPESLAIVMHACTRDYRWLNSLSRDVVGYWAARNELMA